MGLAGLSISSLFDGGSVGRRGRDHWRGFGEPAERRWYRATNGKCDSHHSIPGGKGASEMLPLTSWQVRDSGSYGHVFVVAFLPGFIAAKVAAGRNATSEPEVGARIAIPHYMQPKC
jgi:hypothetical protein